MPRYTLDTDTSSYIMNRSNDSVLRRLQKVAVNDVCISVITKSELLYGVELAPRRQQNEAALNTFPSYVDVLDFPDGASFHYARIRAELKLQGAMIGANDLLIAAHARSLSLTLVTNHASEFQRVRNLAVETWTSRS